MAAAAPAPPLLPHSDAPASVPPPPPAVPSAFLTVAAGSPVAAGCCPRSVVRPGRVKAVR